jgi:aubergine-like protein
MEATNPSTAGFAKRPERAAQNPGKAVKLYSNFFNLEFASPDIKGVFKYQMKLEPEVPDNSHKLRKQIVSKARDAIKEKLAFHIMWGTCLYSNKQHAEQFTVAAEVEEVAYKISIECVQMLETLDRDYQQFLKIFFNSMMRTLRFETIGRKSFNQAAKHCLDAHKIQVWPGFDARLVMKEQGVFLNIDICHKVIRQDTALQNIQQIKETAMNKGYDFKEEISKEMVNTTVVTR